ncbi:biotin--[acetyl-CoA-carboxylase] ligase [Noviherbaspirillum sedimenti]|uniref:biotin--[biotin carboxyl-carrier protein] ligase n=1 Tax=Noviherbaspirillum sedimenti TaxID=2320865 RepID=A0A3A3G3S6_9BURK|nr:biotin--[acetyl-CoA-carboxylase] ligase [Noviherbaspirillum sedimenti]RJG03137.1 biotin--[acetyl-CoA-carboxylase] ligase [Noviherbaspirillum sedimenti]
MNASLSAAAIAAWAQTAASHVAVEVVGQTASTNADLLARVGQLVQPTLLAAASQTAGRGRAGRTWMSDAGASLTFSLAWPVRRSLRELSGLPLAVGVALADTLASCAVPVRLKWPNDLLMDGAKLGGILIETALEKSGGGQQLWAVIGVGMNLALPEELARQIGRPAAALPGAAIQDRNRLLGLLLNGLAGALLQFEREGFAAFMTRWNALHAWAGQAVQILDHDRIVLEGVAVGVDAQGQLLLDTADGRVPVLAGDVSLRMKDEGGVSHVVAG